MAPHDRDQFEDLLDNALRRYADVEPRAGLEGRVLANLAADAGRTRARSMWAWALAGASAIVVLVAVWVGIGPRRPNAPVAGVRPNGSEESVQKTAVVTPPVELNKPAVRLVRSRQTSPFVTEAKAAEPRLEQFPSPRPISAEETMLVEYVQRYPEEAMLIARQQDEFDEQVRQAEREIEKSPSSDQQEK